MTINSSVENFAFATLILIKIHVFFYIKTLTVSIWCAEQEPELVI